MVTSIPNCAGVPVHCLLFLGHLGASHCEGRTRAHRLSMRGPAGRWLCLLPAPGPCAPNPNAGGLLEVVFLINEPGMCLSECICRIRLHLQLRAPRGRGPPYVGRGESRPGRACGNGKTGALPTCPAAPCGCRPVAGCDPRVLEAGVEGFAVYTPTPTCTCARAPARRTAFPAGFRWQPAALARAAGPWGGRGDIAGASSS